ncbi:MAG: hypothetical protein LBQ52_03045 [Helicobacteraceae bacterium]|jgi:hypothetical protein|nr:hypothetical protein [Helicobacteraceae bacterium]
MLSEKKSDPCFGTTKDDMPLDEIYKVMLYLEKCILEYALADIKPDASENEITYLVIKSAQINNNTLFIFNHQPVKHKSSRSEDIGVSMKLKPSSGLSEDFFTIEAKRLDSRLSKCRKKEYVIGERGGIERFKRCFHGEKHKFAGLLGYVQTGNFDEWQADINKWINEKTSPAQYEELVWKDEDKLSLEEKSEKSAKYKSLHSRICKQEKIQLLHLWIQF